MNAIESGRNTMKAAVYEKYGAPEVVHIEDVKKPVPKDNEVLVKIHATTVNSADWRLRSLNVPAGFGILVRLGFGIFGPRHPILGMELAGVIESVGKDVTKFKVGDAVFASADFDCHAEYRTIPEDGPIAYKPANLSFEESAALSFGGETALYFLRDRGKIQNGEKVLVNGASGTVGLAAVQIAKYFGAEVTGVCSTASVDLVKSVEADNVIDYTKEDFTQNGKTYDIIVDTAGTAPWGRCNNSLTPSGRLLVVLGSLCDMVQAPFVSSKGGKTVITGTAVGSAENAQLLALLAAQGKFKPVIDRSYTFEQIVEAHAYVDTGHKRGSVVISMVDPNE